MLIRLSWSMGDPKFSTEAHEVVAGCSNNAFFPDTLPLVTALVDKLKDFDESRFKAPNGGEEDTRIKNRDRKAVELALKKLGWHVLMVAGEDEIKLGSTGFKKAKKPTPVGILPAPVNFMVKPGPCKGSVRITQKKVAGAGSYQLDFTRGSNITSETLWEVVPSRATTLVVEGLVSGDLYSFRRVGIGANPIRVYSEVISTYVL
jgi:hypothetical protein